MVKIREGLPLIDEHATQDDSAAQLATSQCAYQYANSQIPSRYQIPAGHQQATYRL